MNKEKHQSQLSREEAQNQIERNFEAFSQMTFNPQDKGKVALLHDGELISILDTKADAFKMGISLYKQAGLFSIQEIEPEPVDLGFMSYALHSS